MVNCQEELNMITDNEGVNKLRKCKRKLRQLNKIISFYYDEKAEDLNDPETLKQMLLISEINYLLTDIIYYIIDNQISEKQ